MSFIRILGKNDKIYKKFADYCIAEDNECFIVCSCCQEEHQSEETFWAHVRDVHNYELPQTIMHMLPQVVQETEPIKNLPEPKRIKMETFDSDPTVLAESEYLEELEMHSNDPDILNDLSPYLIKDDFITESEENHQTAVTSSKLKSLENDIKIRTTHKFIDVDRIASKALSNSKVLKKVLQQIQRTNIEFKYKLNRLSQEVSVLERELHDEHDLPRKKYMRIIPDKPMTTRDEVLILDGELQRSKEMRNNLHEEALMVITQSPDVYCRVLWRFIMTDEVSNQFCWRGVIDGERVTKYPIKDMMMMDIFQAAFREKFPSLPLNTFKEKTITYFNKANERIKRTQINKIKNDEIPDELYEEVN